MHSLAVVIVTHNSASWLGPFVATWARAADIADMGQIPAVLADSGSEDDTLRTAEQLLPAATFLRLPNCGFGTAANAAIRQIEAAWILLCNPDLTFPPAFAAQIRAAVTAAPDRTAIIAPRLVNPDGSNQPSVGNFPTLTGLLRDQLRARTCRKYTFPQPTAAGPVDWATGACLLLRRAAFMAIRGFDEKYFLYAEEVDLQRRLHDAGHVVWFDPAITATHHQPNAARMPRPEIQRYAARGMLRYFAKYGGGLAGYRLLAFLSGRLSAREAFASRQQILDRPTGP